MHRYILTLILVISFVIALPSIVFAQDSNGNYYKGTLPSEGEYVISTWRVITPGGLNCRSGAGTEFEIVKRFSLGDNFTVEISEGRHTHNNPTELDKQGLPWFRLAKDVERFGPPKASKNCLIRANSRYIAPVISR